MKKQFPHGIDITAPGGIAALMDFHRLTFGNAVMEAGASEPNGEQAPKPAPPATPAPAAESVDDFKTEQSKQAVLADLAEAREARRIAEAKLQEIENAKLSDIERAQKERDEQAAENAKLKATNARLAALAEHPVPKDYQDLVTGTDEASYLASAKKISELYARAEGKAPRPDPVHDSGNRNGDGDPAGGSIAAGRDLYASKHNKSS